MRVRDLEERRVRRAARHRQRRRRRRLAWAFMLGVAISCGIGIAVGYSTRTTAEEVAQEMALKRSPEPTIESEIDRALLELWKMEDWEFTRTRNGR